MSISYAHVGISGFSQLSQGVINPGEYRPPILGNTRWDVNGLGGGLRPLIEAFAESHYPSDLSGGVYDKAMLLQACMR